MVLSITKKFCHSSLKLFFIKKTSKSVSSSGTGGLKFLKTWTFDNISGTLIGPAFQVSNEPLEINTACFSFFDSPSLPLLNQFPFPYTSITPIPSFKFKHLSLLAPMWELSNIFLGIDLFFILETFYTAPVHLMLQLFGMSGYSTTYRPSKLYIFFVLKECLLLGMILLCIKVGRNFAQRFIYYMHDVCFNVSETFKLGTHKLESLLGYSYSGLYS